MFSFTWDYKNYSFRAVTKNLNISDSKTNETIELVWKNNDMVFTIAYWIKSSDGYDLKFVGNRMFEYINSEDIVSIWEMLKICQMILDDFHNKLDEN